MSKLKLNNVEVISDENTRGIPELTDNVVFPSGHLVNSTVATNATSIINTTGNTINYWTFQFTKKLDAANSYIILHGQLPGQDRYSYYVGLYCEIVGANESVRTTDGSAYKGISAFGAYTGTNEPYWIQVLKKFTGLSAGTHTVNFGWQNRNSSTNDMWCHYWNPNYVTDIRNHNARSCVILNEIKI